MKYFTPSKISENISETPEGFLVCIGVSIARVGEMIYGEGETPLEADSAGQVKVFRSEDEVFRPETMASFEGKALTIKHPENFVNPENWSELAKGTLQNVRRGEGEQKDDLIADILVTDKMAIELVKKGLREVSCGYEADYIQTEEGKGEQKNIIGNHLALVDQGRAGPSYAINDSKGDTKMKLKDRIKAVFAKAQDEAMKMADEEEKKDEGKGKATDMYDELVKMKDELVQTVSDLGEKISSMKKDQAQGSVVKKEGEAADDEEKKDDKAKDEGEKESEILERLKTLEAAVEKLLSGKSGDEEKAEDEEEEESEDDDFEESTMTGDAISRAEILAPGIKKSKDLKVKALKAAYETKEGKKVIDALTGGKAPAFDSVETVDTLFIAASEVLKASRTEDLSKTKRTTDYQSPLDNGGVVTAEKMNEINAKYYKRA